MTSNMCVDITTTAEKSGRDVRILFKIADNSREQAHSEVSHGESSIQSVCDGR